jgi:hypothetical protein
MFNSKRRIVVALVLFIACYWCVGTLLTAPAGAAVVQAEPQAAPRTPVQMDNRELCDAWHKEKSAALTSNLRERRILNESDLLYAQWDRIYVGMPRLAVICALGQPVHSRSYVNAAGTTEMQTYLPGPDQKIITVRIENGLVDSYTE